jgi:hypothetical protein
MTIDAELLSIALLVAFFTLVSAFMWGSLQHRPAQKADTRKPRRRSF